MKKYISIVVLFIIILMQSAVLVQAANPCSISLKPDKQTLNKSDEFTVDISMSNITSQDGITGFLAILDYSKEKFELVVDESQDAQDVLAELEGTDYEGCKVLYIGQNDEDEEILNPWTLLLMESEDGTGIAGITNEPQKQSQKIAKIKFKVKDDAASSNSEKITFEELTVVSGTEDVTITNAYTTVKISSSQSISIGSATNTNKNKTNTSTNRNTASSSSYNKTNTSTRQNVASQSNADEVPEAGTPIILPIILVFVGIVIFKYRKYKEEYKNI